MNHFIGPSKSKHRFSHPSGLCKRSWRPGACDSWNILHEYLEIGFLRLFSIALDNDSYYNSYFKKWIKMIHNAVMPHWWRLSIAISPEGNWVPFYRDLRCKLQLLDAGLEHCRTWNHKMTLFGDSHSTKYIQVPWNSVLRMCKFRMVLFLF